MNFIIFDLETTGLDSSNHRIVEFGGIACSPSGEIIRQYEQLIDPEMSMPAGATKVNNITDEMLVGMPTFDKVAIDIMEFLGNPADSVLVAHNSPFDVGFLKKSISSYCGINTPIGFKVYCTMNLSMKSSQVSRYAYRGRISLDKACNALGIQEYEGRHRSIGDCLRTRDVWFRLGGPGMYKSMSHIIL